jgi:hypothetical protein
MTKLRYQKVITFGGKKKWRGKIGISMKIFFYKAHDMVIPLTKIYIAPNLPTCLT